MADALARIHLEDDIDAPSFEELARQAEEVLDVLRELGLCAGTAESCTGGLIAAALTAVPGSSDVVMGSVVSYACSVKESVLGVSAEVLARVGAVSQECARQMADGAVRVLGCDVAVAVTGIAGPGGAVPGKPVGTVWFACSDGKTSCAERHLLSGSRDEVRAKTALVALSLLVDFVKRASDID